MVIFLFYLLNIVLVIWWVSLVIISLVLVINHRICVMCSLNWILRILRFDFVCTLVCWRGRIVIDKEKLFLHKILLIIIWVLFQILIHFSTSDFDKFYLLLFCVNKYHIARIFQDDDLLFASRAYFIYSFSLFLFYSAMFPKIDWDFTNFLNFFSKFLPKHCDKFWLLKW